MVTTREITEALSVFGEIHGREITPQLAKVYASLLAEEFTPEGWRATCRHLAKTSTFWPKPADFLAELERERASSADTEAEEAWAAIQASRNRKKLTVYTPQSSGRLSEERIRAELGPAAASAFAAAGGHQTVDSIVPSVVSFARRDFLAAYCRTLATQRRQTAGLLGDGEPRPRLALASSAGGDR